VRAGGHRHFEALAAALALGEASEAERAEFAAHARSCAVCAADAAHGSALVGRLAAARDDERWQPHLDGDIGARLSVHRTQRSKQTFAVLGYAVAASLVVNVAFVGGFAGRALDALRVTPAPEAAAVNSLRIVLEHRAPREPAALALHRATRLAPHAQVAFRAPAPVARREAAAPPPAAPADVPVPDVFAGIALESTALDRSVAFAQLCAEVRAADRPLPAGCDAIPAAPAR